MAAMRRVRVSARAGALEPVLPMQNVSIRRKALSVR